MKQGLHQRKSIKMYLTNLFVAIDQLGNVLAGGNPDNTISSRVGYYTKDKKHKKVKWRWLLLENIINTTFYPIDGENHCREAFYNDAGEVFDEGTSDYAIAALFIIIFISCLLIGLILYPLYALGVVSPKKINRTANIKKRLDVAEARLNGTLHELNNHKVKVDDELKKDLLETETVLDLISEKINGILKLTARLETWKGEQKNASSQSDPKYQTGM